MLFEFFASFVSFVVNAAIGGAMMLMMGLCGFVIILMAATVTVMIEEWQARRTKRPAMYENLKRTKETLATEIAETQGVIDG